MPRRCTMKYFNALLPDELIRRFNLQTWQLTYYYLEMLGEVVCANKWHYCEKHPNECAKGVCPPEEILVNYYVQQGAPTKFLEKKTHGLCMSIVH